MICEIDDKGIGKEAFNKINSGLNKQKKSRGIEIAKKRLELQEVSQLGEKRIQIVDKYDVNGIPTWDKSDN
tara:strand:+ start:9446 stop:9658 length:213 start_codon:yes stop_codon:yes gene_type:complete